MAKKKVTKKKVPVEAKTVPTGVKIISVFYYISAALGVLFGIMFIIGAGLLGSMLSQIPMLGFLGSGLFIIGGIIMIGMSVLSFFIARGLWKARQWARIVTIIFACLGLLTAILLTIQMGIASNIVGLVLNAAIGGYLVFSSKVKEAFA